jgi:DeoR/GlpR family transcriptional regulator of sugar metabolism
VIASERRQLLFDAIESAGVASIPDLAKRFHVARITITRDLQEMEREGLVRRVRGGAISVRGTSYEPPYSARETQALGEKRRIAERAVGLVHDGDSLLLDVGTTTLQVARALRGKRNLTILVTNLRAAIELASLPAIEVIVVGGKLRASELSMVGQLAEETLRRFQVDTAFIGTGGITIKHGLTEFNVDEAGTKRVMMSCARQRVALLDHSKLGKVMLTSVAPVTDLDVVITGKEADPDVVRRLSEAGVEVLLA